MIGTYASAILISAAAVVLGRGICVLSGCEGSSWLSPTVGFAALMVLCDVAISLPGRAWTAVAATVLGCAAAVWIAARRGAAWPSAGDAAPVALVVLGFVSVPFLANARVGVLGVSLLNDTHWHLILAEGLRRPAIKTIAYGTGYPLGPHAVAATLAQGIGSDVDKTLTGVLMATPVLTGLAALGMLTDVSRPRRWLVAVLAAVPYLAAAWYIQSAFKEPILSLLLLGLVLALQAGRREAFARPAAVLVPAAVLTAGVLYDYSYPGLLWPIGIVGCWLALELVLGGAWRRAWSIARGLQASAPAFALGGLVLVVLVAPEISRIHAFWVSNGGTAAGTVGGITTSALADLAGPLRAVEGLNIWLSGDFRFVPGDALTAGVFVGLALLVLVYAIASSLKRRDLVWPGAMLAFALIYVYLKHTQSPYVAAKALMIPAPLLMLGSGAALMRRLERPDWRSGATFAVAGIAVLFFFLSFYSSYLVLRNAFVDPDNHINELRSLRPLLHGRPTLALFYDDYVQWELLGVPVSSPLLASPISAPVQAAKPWSFGQPLDFDSVDAATLNQFAYVITTRTSAQSIPPPNFHLVGSSRSYEVWKRVGPTPPHRVLAESGAPGAVLDCRTPGDRQISRERGYAVVRPEPRYFNLSPLVPGGSEQVALTLPAGEWDMSIPFTSDQALTVRGAGLDTWLPPNLDRTGEIWPVGRIRTTGSPITLTLTMSHPGLLSSSSQFFTPQPMVAVSVAPARTVPLHAACGRYVDWYVVT